MRAVIQRVSSSCVSVDGEVKGSIKKGYNILLGVMHGDGQNEAELLAKKIAALRVIEDEEGKMNLSIIDTGGEVLVISQFTLCADMKKGNRPSFFPSAEPQTANELYEYFCECLKQNGIKKIEKGVFGADMLVEINNDGPVTIVMDTEIWSKKNAENNPN